MSTINLVSAGEMLAQAPGPFSNSSISGIFSFGTTQRTSLNGNLQSGVTAVGSSNLTMLTDSNAAGSILTLGTETTPSYFIGSDGTGYVASGNIILCVVSPELWLGIDGNAAITDPALTAFAQ
jgi:hypothetical protein